MEKKLPSIFANQINKEFQNNERVFYGKKEEKEERTERKEEVKSLNTYPIKSIEQKINQVFKSNHYIYKIEVVMQINGKKQTKKIIGKNRDYLITMDKELIPIKDIEDIEINNEKKV